MSKILVRVFFVFSILLSCAYYAKAESTVEQLIEEYLKDNSCANTFDCMSPFYYKIADKGPDAVVPLLEALGNKETLYVQHRLDFIYLLGMIGDTNAYSALRAVFLKNTDYQDAHMWRLAISLGACLGEENIDDFVVLVVRDAADGALRALREMSGQDFGQNEEQWAAYLNTAGHLETFRANCRERSKPILG